MGHLGVDDDIEVDIEGKRCDICVMIGLQNGHPWDQLYQKPTRCSKFFLIDSLKSTLHVSGDSFAHLQEHLDCIYPLCTMHPIYRTDGPLLPRVCFFIYSVKKYI